MEAPKTIDKYTTPHPLILPSFHTPPTFKKRAKLEFNPHMNKSTTAMTTTTTTTATIPTEWFQQFYNLAGGRSSESTTNNNTTTPPPTTYSPPSLLGSSNSPTSPNPVPPTGSSKLSPVQEGRVSKPARRRTRASRKNPTTLLNTDTTNFRAMVQRYTGGATPYSPPFDSPAGFMSIGGGLHLGNAANFNQAGSGLIGLHNYGSLPGGADMQAHQLHQQLLQQYGGAAFNAGPAATRGEEEGVSSFSHAGPRVGPGSGPYSDGSGAQKFGI